MMKYIRLAAKQPTYETQGEMKNPNLDSPVLLPLTPKYDPERHRIYLEVIEAALENHEDLVRNIALTGSYGVGKSSVLSEVAHRHKRKAISISLSTLGFAEEEQSLTGDTAKNATTKTNRIQKEIVKQLIYSEDPVRTPGSRYHRNSRFRFWRALWLSATLSIPVVVVFLLTGWTDTIAALAPLSSQQPLLRHVALFAGSIALLLCYFALFHNRFQIEKLGTGATTISLSPKSASYFDEYLDEIVYFFDVAKRDIVIFEDIDRFDDAHIFETLRSLNSILNGAKQLKGRKIRFIYAIKDSIFEELGTRAANEELSDEIPNALTSASLQSDAAEAEVARANRTKFFDLVVPVVPFITHRSARDLLVRTMRKELSHGVSDELIDLTARYIADMRLIKNIRNEFAIFKAQTIDSGTLELLEDRLFAIVLYKSVHLADFELIKLGKSNLDDLYRDSRSLISGNLKTLTGLLSTERLQRQKLSPITNARAKSLGDSLATEIEQLLGYASRGAASVQSYSIEGRGLDDSQLRTPEFWEAIAAMDASAAFQIHYYDNSSGARVMRLPRADIESRLKIKIDSAVWLEQEQKRLDLLISSRQKSRDFLLRADMKKLYARPEFTLSVNGYDYSFEELARKHLGSELALRLVEGGYIDQSFTLYTSMFHADRVSANAMNYILKNVEPNTIDMHFRLSADEVEAILRERGRGVLQESSAYNVNILDYLAKQDSEGLHLVASRLTKAGAKERELISAYLESGSSRDVLVQELATCWEDILVFLTSEARLDTLVLNELVDIVLNSINSEVDITADKEVREYLEDQYSNLGVLTSDSTTDETASQITALLHRADVELSELRPLSRKVLDGVVENGDYALSRDNLLVALDDPEHPLSLDSIKAANEGVYRRVLKNIETYIQLLNDDQVTVCESSAFAAILNDIATEDNDVLSAVIHRVSRHCIVENLDAVPDLTWTALAEENRFPVTFINVQAYINEFGLDEQLAQLLAASEEIDTPEGLEEEIKIEVALRILKAEDQLPSPRLRAELVQSLGLSSPVSASSVPVEAGELVGWLIEKNIVEDNAATFEAIESGSVDGRAFAIGKSSSFRDFMSEREIPASIVGQLITHPGVPNAVKNLVISRFAEFTTGSPKEELALVVQYAVENGQTIMFEDLTGLAGVGIDSEIMLALVEPHLPSLDATQLASIVRSIGGTYAALSEPNGKHPRIANTKVNLELVERLKQVGLVNSSSEKGQEIKVNMKQS